MRAILAPSISNGQGNRSVISPLTKQRLTLAVLLLTLIPFWPFMPILVTLALTGKFDQWWIKGPVIVRGEWNSSKIRFAPEFRMNAYGARVIALPHVNEIGRKAHRFWQRK
jgi:hypothetical protein